MKNNTEIFEEFWTNFKWPEPKTILYRLYYDDQGVPVAYSQEDLPGKYIELTPEQYALADSKVLVRNGQLIKKTNITTSKLVPSDEGTECHLDAISIVVKDNGQKWKLKHYDNS